MTPNPIPMTTPNTFTPTLPDQQMNFPLEIFLIIIPMLAHPELAQCRRVSQFFSSIATPYFYKRQRIDLSKPETLENPVDATGKHTRFSFIEHLTITSHSGDVCKDVHPINLPNLITLRILGGQRGCHTSSASYLPSSTSKPCAFLAHLQTQARRLVINADLGEFASGSPRPGFPSVSSKELVVVVGPNNLGARGGLYYGVRGSVERLTLVFQPEIAVPDEGSVSASQTLLAQEMAANSRLARAYMISNMVAGACRGRAVPTTVVGLGPLGGTGGDSIGASSIRQGVEYCKVEVQYELVNSRGMTEEAAAVRVEGINFIELKDCDGEVC